MAGRGAFQPFDPGRCDHYAKFASRLDRSHFEGLYWALFILVIFFLFLASWIYQWTMWYKEKPYADMDVFRRKMKRALVATIFIFLTSAATIVIETFCLLALQFCDGEDLMSLYWSTWTMMQIGSQIAIGGVVLALWHSLCNVKHPIWALAMGTPVLVVAGLGHVISLCLHRMYKKAKAKHQANSLRGESRSRQNSMCDLPVDEKAAAAEESSGSTINEETPGPSYSRRFSQRPSLMPSLMSTIGTEERFFFEIDVGSNSEVIRQWPSFVSMSEGRALIQAVLLRPGSDTDLEGRPWSPETRESRPGQAV